MTSTGTGQTWNTLQVEIVAADLMLRPLIGAAATTREQAHAQVQHILDQGVATARRANPALAGRVERIAQTWRRGAKDDTVTLVPFVHAIYPCPPGEELPAAMEWLSDFAATMRGAGMNVTIAAPRQQPRPEDQP